MILTLYLPAVLTIWKFRSYFRVKDSGENNLLDLQRTYNPGTQYCDSHHE